MGDLNVHKISYGSLANGPGVRTVLHVQGCTLACRGCVNKSTWGMGQGSVMTEEEVVDLLLQEDADGITISGGEPLEQWVAVRSVVGVVLEARPSWTVVLFSGFTEKEILGQPATCQEYRNRWEELSAVVDTAILGRFEGTLLLPIGQRRNLISTSNQEIHHLSGRAKYMADMPEAEIDIRTDGTAVFRGVAGHSILP